MSSSPSRSTLSLRLSSKTPAWRSNSLSKNSPHASISFVIAEPEQGSPLASATSKLPSQIELGQGAELVINQGGTSHSLEMADNTSQHLRAAVQTSGARPGRAVSDSIAPRRVADRSPSTPDQTTRANQPLTMLLKRRKTLRRGSSASTGWLASMTKEKGKEREIAPPIVTLSLPADTTSLDAPYTDDSAAIASSSKISEEDDPQASDVLRSPPSPSVPTSQTPTPSSSTDPQTADVTPGASPSDHGPSSDLPASDVAQSVTCANDPPSSSTENKATETDPTRSLPEETSKKMVNSDSVDNRSWFGAWVGWSPSPPASKEAHGGSILNGDPGMRRTDHDRQGSRHESESQESNTLDAPSFECHTESTSTLSDAHGDLHQPCSSDGNQISVRAEDLAVVPHCDPLVPSPPSNNHDPASPTSDKSDIITVPAEPSSPSTGKDIDQPSRPPAQPETAVETTWWDYIGWRSSAVSLHGTARGTEPPPAQIAVRVNGDMGTDLNADSGVGKINDADKDGNDDEGGQGNTSPQPRAFADTPIASGASEMADDHVTLEVGGKGTARATAASQNLFPPLPGTSGAAEASLGPSLDPGMGGPCAPSLAEPSAQSREGGKQDQGQDQLHVGGAGGGTWYKPWSWYGSSYAADDGGKRGLADLPPDEGSEKPVQIQNDEKCDGLEMAVDADTALRPVAGDSGIEQVRSETEMQLIVADSSESMPSSIAGAVEINPIAATIDTHRSSWLSFFASRNSRTLLMKSIEGPSPDSVTQTITTTTNTIEVDENGMEVMDISDDGVPPASPPVPVPIMTRNDKEIKASYSPVPPSQSLVATLVRGRGKVRGSPPRAEQDTGSDTSSIKSVGQKSDAMTPGIEINGAATPPRPEQDALSTGGSLPSSPPRTTSLVKRASLTLASSNTKANGNNGMSDPPKSASPTPSSKSKKLVTPPPPPNLILPAWQDTFNTAPRNVVPPPETSALTKTVRYVSGILSSARSGNWSIPSIGQGHRDKGKRRASSVEREREREHEFAHFGTALPRAWEVLNTAHGGATLDPDVLRGCKRVVVIGVHGWFPGAVMRTVIGEPTGTSSKFANMTAQALQEFQAEHGVSLEKVTKIPLEGEGTIKLRVDKLYASLLGSQEWMDDIHAADAILVSTHSQGSIVSTHLLDRLISDRHIRTARNSVVVAPAGSFPSASGMDTAPAPRPQKVCCLAMCGIHLGPLRYLSKNSLFQPYFQYIENPAARELFEFQNTESEVSKDYVRALKNVLSNGVKMVYVASLNDQVVPIYSGVFTAASHPLILRALYIDGDAYHSSDFLANLLVLLLRILNSGIPDSGLLAHLSEATAGSLNGVGHSTVYEEIATYALAVKYLFLSNDGLEEHPDLYLDPFNASNEQNDYEIPWALRDVIADQRVTHFFSKEIVQLRDAFRGWHPRTTILRDLKRKLQPIQRLPASFATSRL